MNLTFQSNEIDKLAASLSKAQGIIRGASRDATNPFYKSKYATLDSVWESIREPLSLNGLAVVQTINAENGGIFLTTTLMHSSGQWIRSNAPLIGANPSPQAFGSACSYIRRYSLCAIIGVTWGDDDDAEKAEEHHRSKNPASNESSRKREFISSQEAEKINEMIGNDEEYKDSLLKYFSNINHFEISSFEDLPRENYASCIKALNKRKQKKNVELEKIKSII